MAQEEFQKYLKERYEDQAQWYNQKATANKKVYLFFQWGLIVLSAITPILIGIDQDRLTKKKLFIS